MKYTVIVYKNNKPLYKYPGVSASTAEQAVKKLNLKLGKGEFTGKNYTAQAIKESVNEVSAPIKDLLKKMPSHVKGWAKYVAQHKNGEWWYYDSVPKLVPNVGWRSWDKDGYQFGSNIKTNPKGWESSQQKLKESVNEDWVKDYGKAMQKVYGKSKGEFDDLLKKWTPPNLKDFAKHYVKLDSKKRKRFDDHLNQLATVGRDKDTMSMIKILSGIKKKYNIKESDVNEDKSEELRQRLDKIIKEETAKVMREAQQLELRSLNEEKWPSYNLGIDTKKRYEYEKVIGQAISKLPGIADYTKMARDYGKWAVQDSADWIQITQYGTKDNTSKLKSILSKVDPNLDVSTMKNNFKAGPTQRSQHAKDHDMWEYMVYKKDKYWDLKRASKNKGEPDKKMSPEVVDTLLDMMAQYSTTQHQLANQQWRTLKDFMQAATDHMSASNYKKFAGAVKKKYPNIKESVNEAKNFKKGDKVRVVVPRFNSAFKRFNDKVGIVDVVQGDYVMVRLKGFKSTGIEFNKSELVKEASIPRKIGFKGEPDFEHGLVREFFKFFYIPADQPVGIFMDMANVVTDRYEDAEPLVRDIGDTAQEMFDYLMPPPGIKSPYDLHSLEDSGAAEAVWQYMVKVNKLGNTIIKTTATANPQKLVQGLRGLNGLLEKAKNIFTSNFGPPKKRRVGFKFGKR